jgi:hypothetical protein
MFLYFAFMTHPSFVLRTSRTRFASLGDPEFPSVWNLPVSAVLSFADGSVVPPHLHTSIRTVWNEDSLFILFEAAFLELRLAPVDVPVEPSGKTLKLWEHSDVVECFIGSDAASTRRYKEFQVAPDARWTDVSIEPIADARAGGMMWTSGARFHSTVDHQTHRWRAIIDIPWRSLEILPLLHARIDCNFYRATGRFHGDEILTWSPTGYGENCFHRVEKFGRLEIVE